MKGVDAMDRQKRISDKIASLAGALMKCNSKKVRSIAAAALANRRWGKS